MKIENLDIARLGHDTFRIKSKLVIYTDPFQIKSGEPADLILVSHEHFDHCDLEAIKAISKEDTEIVGSKLAVEKIGRGRALSVGETVIIKGVEIKGVPAYNTKRFRAPGVPYHPKESQMLGFVFVVDGVRLYFAGDTGFIPEMKELRDIDIAFLPISDVYVMNEEEAVEAVKAIKPKIAIPMHYGAIPGVKGDPKKFEQMVGELARVINLDSSQA